VNGALVAEEVRWWAAAYDPGPDARGRRSREALLALVGAVPDPGSRTQFAPGHVTVSGLVLSHERNAVLLVFHERLQRWLQPGGHLEPSDRTLVDAARREVREETGLIVEDPAPVLVGVDVHDIPAAGGEPPHRHHDLMFRFVCPRAPGVVGGGVLRAAWCPLDGLGRYGVDEPLRAAVARAVGG